MATLIGDMTAKSTQKQTAEFASKTSQIMVGVCIAELMHRIISLLFINRVPMPMDDQALTGMVTDAFKQFKQGSLAAYEKNHPYYINQQQTPAAYQALTIAIELVTPKMVFEQCKQYTVCLYNKAVEIKTDTDLLSLNTLAFRLDMTTPQVQQLATTENWPWARQSCGDVVKQMYSLRLLPATIKNQIRAVRTVREYAYVVSDGDKQVKLSISELYAKYLSLPIDTTKLTHDGLILRLLDLARISVVLFEQTKTKGFDDFCEQYNNKTLGIDSAIYTIINHIARIVLLRWEKKEQALRQEANRNKSKAVTGNQF